MFELSRFSASSFEEFAQTLAMSVIGPEMKVFGSGPDGAREASYDGNLTIGGKQWSGYTVIQAKYKARLSYNGPEYWL